MRRFLAARAAGLVAGACVFYGLLVGVIALEGWLGADVMAAVVAGGFAYGVAVAVLALVADRGGDRLALGCSCLGSTDDSTGWSLVDQSELGVRGLVPAGRRPDVLREDDGSDGGQLGGLLPLVTASSDGVYDGHGPAGDHRAVGQPVRDYLGVPDFGADRFGDSRSRVVGQLREPHLDGSRAYGLADHVCTCDGVANGHSHSHDGSADYVADRLADHLRAFAVADRDNDGSRGLNLDRLALDYAHGDRDGLSPSVIAERGRPGRLDAERDRGGADRSGAALRGPAGAGAAPVIWVAP